MSDLFSNYENEYNEVVNTIKLIISSFSKLPQNEAEKTLTDSVNLVKDGNEILMKMEIETSANGTLTLLNKCKEYKYEFQLLKNKVNMLQDNYIIKKADSVMILGTEDTTPKNNHNGHNDLIRLQNIRLIPNEQDHVNEISIDQKNNNPNQQLTGINEVVQIDYNMKKIGIDSKNKRILIISSSIIVCVLVILIILICVLN